MGVQGVTQTRHKANGGVGGEILRGHGKRQACQSESDKQQRHPHDISVIGKCNAAVDHSRNDHRNEKLQRSLQELEKRTKHTFLPVFLQISKELSHNCLRGWVQFEWDASSDDNSRRSDSAAVTSASFRESGPAYRARR